MASGNMVEVGGNVEQRFPCVTRAENNLLFHRDFCCGSYLSSDLLHGTVHHLTKFQADS